MRITFTAAFDQKNYKSMRQFPVILIPPEVQRIAQSKPVAPKLSSPPRLTTSEQPQPIDIQEAIALSFGLIFIVALVTTFAKELGIMLLIVGTVALVLRIRYQFLTYKKRYQSYQNTLQNYFKKLETYSREEVGHEQKLAIAHSPERILEFRHQQFKKFFAKRPAIENAIAVTQSNPPDHNKSAIYDFGITLQQHLSGTIYQGVKLYIPSVNQDWLPTLTYIDPVLNVHIAIEIIGDSESAANLMQKDLSDRFLVDSGWIMIKFSQKQILHSSAQCCKEFAKLLDRLSLDPSVLPNFESIPDLAPIKI
ncbi:MAG: hypothetical protein ACK5VA_22475 [Pseudanabaena sp.]|nr:hypothetical protein [Pseudanabaena sp. M090S1SP2A07QC]MCA6508453.1 hypothetical protein [Pseudanabaena sp. M109S1SP2A07QC]MCA6521711.1 hypothetical protein [Pseudanabaena sp. M051S1SP2A07QC]MCA6527881.1 hypothetical protein [Pseudanabaena sp. M179S2SP2A07QC]MCA6529696.1 hypothetical protein [Pseudanabaena sp. M125S2SP2A07QC]MCA6532749.1 hypothetical protein [Pseudanabaena sp. M176S2SP2A07QC]MCA6540289.1 hypothetical protein [Pseudanabaena sp. M037S2SP2A07QC]MCA6544756.1 hypothetical prot